MSTEQVVDIARGMQLTPLAMWVLDESCSKTIVVPLKQPKYRNGRRIEIGRTEWVCLRVSGHRGDCSPTLERGDERNA